jgi:hypothetical protein
LVGPHERSITGSKQKFRIDEGTEEGIARSAIESPQPLRLRRRQAKSRHFGVFALNTPQHVVMRLLLDCHNGAPSQFL